MCVCVCVLVAYLSKIGSTRCPKIVVARGLFCKIFNYLKKDCGFGGVEIIGKLPQKAPAPQQSGDHAALVVKGHLINLILLENTPAPQQSGDHAAINFRLTSHPGKTMLRCSSKVPQTRSGRQYSGVVSDAGVIITVVTKTRSRRPYKVVVPDAKIKQEKLDGASSLVPGGVVVEEGQRGAPASEGVMVAYGANAQVALRNQADQSAHVIGGNLVTA